MTPKDFDGRRRRYVPMDVFLAFGTFGTKLLDKWGMDGLCTWMLFLAACKREPNEGTFTYASEDEAWSKIGARPTPGGLTLDAFWTFTGHQKKTSRTRHGRVTYVVCTRWKDWNTPKTSGEKSSKTQENTEEIPDENRTITAPELEVEVEGENEGETLTALTRLRVADPVWDFVTSIEGEPLPRYKAGRGRIVVDLKACLDGADVAELYRRHDALAREWGDAKATARALVQHWTRAGKLADGEMRPAQRDDGRLSVDALYQAAEERQRAERGGLELDAG